MLKNDGVALLIGVDDYSAYDASLKNAPGTSDLFGGRNDVIALYRVLRALGYEPANIRALTSPRIDSSALEGALAKNLGEATEEAILAGFSWLCERMGEPSAPSGVFAYSGHGDFLEGQGLVFCPSDIAGPRLDRAILVETLQSMIRQRGVGANLTVILDACHAGGVGARRARSLTGRALPAALREKAPALGDRVLAATQPGGVAFQGTFSGVCQGAFTFALGAVMDQWQAVQEGPTNVRLDLSHGELMKRVGALLATLSFDQRPALHGPADVANLSVFQRGSRPDATVAAPDARRPEAQVDSGSKNYTLYQLTYQSRTQPRLNWQIVSVGSSEYPYESNGQTYTFAANMEYWNIDSAFASTVEDAVGDSTLAFVPGLPADWPTSKGSLPGFPASGTITTVVFSKDVDDEEWNAIDGAPPANLFASVSPDGAPTSGVAVAFSLAYDSTTRTYSVASTMWYAIAASGSKPSTTVIPSLDATTLTYMTSQPPAAAANYQWFVRRKSVKGTASFAYAPGS